MKVIGSTTNRKQDQGKQIDDETEIWTPREKLSTGIELIWGMPENADDDDGDATRVQTMVMYTLIMGATLRMRFEVTSTT